MLATSVTKTHIKSSKLCLLGNHSAIRTSVDFRSRCNKLAHKSHNGHVGFHFVIHVKTIILKGLAGFSGVEIDMEKIFSVFLLKVFI
jgi:hypothetical protein